MTHRQGIVLAGRVASLYFFYCALANLLNLPGMVLSVAHHLRSSSTAAIGADFNAYWSRYYSMGITTALIRLTIELALGLAFYRCGPRITNYLSDEK